MDLEDMTLSERSHTQKDTQRVIPLVGNVQNMPSPQRQKVGSWYQGLGQGGGE